MTEKRILPKQGTGYELGKDRKGYLSVIVPEELTINYIENPIFATGKEPYSYFGGESDNWYGYTGVNATPSDNDRALTMKDSYAIKVTPIAYTDPTEYKRGHGIKYSTTVPAGTYTFSAYFSATAGREFFAYVKSDAAVLLSGIKTENSRGANDFTRIYITFTITAQTDINLFLLEASVGDSAPPAFYTSAWMLEDNSYVTSFFSGDSTEKTFFDKGTAYGWYGNRSYSTSFRTPDAYSSGREVNLSDACLHIEAIVGLGINPSEARISSISSGGGIYDGHSIGTRTFTLVGTIYGRDLQEVLNNERLLYELIRPVGANIYQQPTTMLFRIWDECENTWIGQPLYIYCRYQSGFEGSVISETSEKISLMFVCEDPFLYSAYEERQELTASAKFEPPSFEVEKQYIIHRDQSGDWELLDIECDDLVLDDFLIRKIIKDVSNSSVIYFMGNFLDANGIADTQSLFAYNKVTGVVSSIGALGTVGAYPYPYVFDALMLPNGVLIIAGTFSDVDSVADTACIAAYDTVAGSWSSVGGGVPGVLPGTVYKIVLGTDNSLYASGDFEDIGSVADASNFAKYSFDTDTWYKCGAVNNIQEGIIYNIDIIPGSAYGTNVPDKVIAAGSFMVIDNVTPGTDTVALWNGTAWESMGWSETTNLGARVFYSSDGVLYLHAIQLDGGYYIYKYSGSLWTLYSTSDYVNSAVVFKNVNNTIAFMPNSSIWTVQNAFSDIILFTKDFQTFTTEEISYDDTSVTNYGAFLYENDNDINGELWVAVSRNANTIYPKRTEVVNNGENCYPIIKVTGDCNFNSIKNNTTKKTVLIDGIRILDRSVAKINFSNDVSYQKIFTINDGGENLVSHIVEMSDMNFYLSPGKNDMHVFYTALTANASSEIWFREKYASIAKATEYIGG